MSGTPAGRAVIIGSGVGGLSAAILLLQQGWSVTVLEQHTRAGGFLHRFFRAGRGYDTGFHYVGSAAPDQLVGRLLTRLGVYDAVDWLPLDPDGFDVIRYPGLQVRVPQGVTAWRDRLAALFPDERAALHRYFALHAAATASYGWYNLDPSIPATQILPFEEVSLAAVLRDHFVDPRLRALLAGQSALYGVPPEEAPFGLHAIVTDHFLQGAWAIRGGGDKLALALVRQLRALGGTLHLRAEAAHIEVDGGSVAAVRTADQRRFPADLVLANAHPATTVALLPEGAVRPAYQTRVAEATPGRAHLGLYLQVEGDLTDLARRNLYRFDAWDPDVSAAPARPGHLPFWFLTAPGGRDASHTADGVVLGLAQVPWADVAGLDRSSAAYHAYKDAMRDTFLDAIRRDYPGWVVRRAEVSTPLTTERFTRSPHGATYGHYHSVAQMGRYRLPMFNRVRGLVHVGQSVGFPGICGAMMSTYVALSEVLGVETLLAGLRAG